MNASHTTLATKPGLGKQLARLSPSLLLLTLFVACGPEDEDALLDEPALAEDAQLELDATEAEALPVIDNWSYTPMNWSDWSGLSMRQLDASLTGNLVVSVCAEHFPQGSQGRDNIELVLEHISAIPGVAIQLSSQDVSHRSNPYAEPPADVLLIDYDDTGNCGGAGCGPVYCPGTGDWDSCGAGVGTAGAVLLPPGQHGDHYADPYEVSDAPSIGFFAHELGHVFGFRHLDARTDESTWTLHALTVGRDSSAPRHATDFRDVYPSAFTLYQLREHYPGGGDVGDLATPEWYMHQMLVSNPPGGAFDEATFENANPWALYRDAGTGTYLNCETDLDPGFFVQYSELSTAPSGAAAVSVSLEVENRFGLMSTVASRNHGPKQSEADYVQFDWRKSVELTVSSMGIVTDPAGEARIMRARVDPNNAVAERLESNNVAETTLMLYPDQASCPI